METWMISTIAWFQTSESLHTPEICLTIAKRSGVFSGWKNKRPNQGFKRDYKWERYLPCFTKLHLQKIAIAIKMTLTMDDMQLCLLFCNTKTVSLANEKVLVGRMCHSLMISWVKTTPQGTIISVWSCFFPLTFKWYIQSSVVMIVRV